MSAEIYAQQLFGKGYGHALWYPEPSTDLTADQKIEIGDVGYIVDGSFIRFFNVMKGEDDETNKTHGLGECYTRLLESKMERVLPNEIQSGKVLSRSVKQKTLDVTLDALVSVLLFA